MAEVSVPGQTTATSAPYVRQKSGLVRTAGVFNAFSFCIANISVGVMVAWGQFFGLAYYPGASAALALAIATVAGIIVVWAYQYWGQIFPRSGGDFIFLSRGLSPGIGLGVNMVFVVIASVSPALVMGILMPLLSSFSSALYDATGWHFFVTLSTWFAGNWALAIVGTFLLGSGSAISLLGLKPTLRFIQGLFLVGFVGCIILMIALLASSASTFTNNLATAVHHSPVAIEDAATKAGFVNKNFDFIETLKLTVWYTPSLLFAFVLVYIGGEIKDARRTVRLSAPAAVAFSGVLAIIWSVILNHIFAPKLAGALAYNSAAAPSYSTPGVPYPHELMHVLWGTSGGGLVLTIIGFLTFIAWIWLWTPSTLTYCQRAIFAWGLDGLLPAWMSRVDEKRHTPVSSIVAAFLIGEALMLIYAFHTSFRTIVLAAVLYACIAVTLLVGIFFPYVRPALYRQSTARGDLFGIPLMSIFCTIGFGILAWQVLYVWTDPIAAGKNPTAVWVTIGAVVGAFAYYLGLKEYRRRKGEDISLTFKQIPVE